MTNDRSNLGSGKNPGIHPDIILASVQCVLIAACVIVAVFGASAVAVLAAIALVIVAGGLMGYRHIKIARNEVDVSDALSASPIDPPDTTPEA